MFKHIELSVSLCEPSSGMRGRPGGNAFLPLPISTKPFTINLIKYNIRALLFYEYSGWNYQMAVCSSLRTVWLY